MSSVFAGVLRNPKASRSSSKPEAARAGCLGADASNRLGRAEREHAGTDLRPASEAILGPETLCFIAAESDQNGKARAAGTGLLPRQGILLGRRHSLRSEN
jgi:hypothetical protein